MPQFSQGPRLPRRWIIHQQPNLVLSTISIVRAADAIEAGNADTIEFSISPDYARSAADALAEAREGLTDLREIAGLFRPHREGPLGLGPGGRCPHGLEVDAGVRPAVRRPGL